MSVLYNFFTSSFSFKQRVHSALGKRNCTEITLFCSTWSLYIFLNSYLNLYLYPYLYLYLCVRTAEYINK